MSLSGLQVCFNDTNPLHHRILQVYSSNRWNNAIKNVLLDFHPELDSVLYYIKFKI